MVYFWWTRNSYIYILHSNFKVPNRIVQLNVMILVFLNTWLQSVENIFFRFQNIKLISSNNLPSTVTACSLPVLVKPCNTYLVSGMCHILRYMIKSSSQQDHSIMKLLGYKYSCFKCSSEVSSRTYMCEVAASNYIDQVGTYAFNWFY